MLLLAVQNFVSRGLLFSLRLLSLTPATPDKMLAPVYFAASLLALGGSPASVDRTKRIAHRTRVFTPTNYTVVPDREASSSIPSKTC